MCNEIFWMYDLPELGTWCVRFIKTCVRVHKPITFTLLVCHLVAQSILSIDRQTQGGVAKGWHLATPWEC